LGFERILKQITHIHYVEIPMVGRYFWKMVIWNRYYGIVTSDISHNYCYCWILLN